MDLKDITFLNDVEARLEPITEEIIVAMERHLSAMEDGDQVIGTVERLHTKALYVLSMFQKSEAHVLIATSLAAIDEIIEKDSQERAALSDAIGEFARDLFWAQAKTDLGWWKNESVGIRKGWVLVQVRELAGPSLQGLLMGRFPK